MRISAPTALSTRMELSPYSHTHRVYRLAAVNFTSAHSTLRLDVCYRAMFGDGSECSGAQQQSGAPEHFGIGAENHMKIPIVEVAFEHDKWWSLPQEMSAELYDKYVNGEDAVYTWDWGEGGRTGSWKPDGEKTHINRYMIHFATGIQTNLDNQRKRSIRIIWVRPQDVVPQFTGQLPTTEQ